MLGVPANANSNQRFLTVEPFQRAGFQVLGLLNEPSAASIEYGHRNRVGSKATNSYWSTILAAAPLTHRWCGLKIGLHSVVASEGVPDVGGDDFDIVLVGYGFGERRPRCRHADPSARFSGCTKSAGTAKSRCTRIHAASLSISESCARLGRR